jgi:hypothetical protein
VHIFYHSNKKLGRSESVFLDFLDSPFVMYGATKGRRTLQGSDRAQGAGESAALNRHQADRLRNTAAICFDECTSIAS